MVVSALSAQWEITDELILTVVLRNQYQKVHLKSIAQVNQAINNRL